MMIQTVNSAYLLLFLLIIVLCVLNLSVANETPKERGQKEKNGALSVVSDKSEDEDDIVTVEESETIRVENPEQFIPTKEWKKIKPGQAIPKGLHVRMNMQTGEKEARLMQEKTEHGKGTYLDIDPKYQGMSESRYSVDELKKMIMNIKSEQSSEPTEDGTRGHTFRTYEDLKKDFEGMNVVIKTDAEIVTNLVEKFRTAVVTNSSVRELLPQLEYYLHQVDNAVLFCDLGAMPLLLKCLNDSAESVRSEAALTLGSALQSNPKVQISALENGIMHELLRIVAVDPSFEVQKHSLFALSALLRSFPFAQKHFLNLGGLSAFARLFDNSSAHKLQLKAVTLLTDLIKEKNLHTEYSDLNDSVQKERVRQYDEIQLQQAMFETGWCHFIPTLLATSEHDSREKVMTAMEIVLPLCKPIFKDSLLPLLQLQIEYTKLAIEEENDGDENIYFGGLLGTVQKLVTELSQKDEL